MKRALLLLVIVSALACKRGDAAQSESKPAPVASIEVKGRRVDVRADANGFTPKEVKVKKGEPTTLVFTRTTDETCATAVVFPEIKVTKDLPLNQQVAIEVPVDQPRTLAFQCGMGMYKSKVVIE